MKVLSVIIPSYNIELYLERCLDSLLYNEDILDLLDIVVVNDGSSDKTLEIANSYKKHYPSCIQVIDKKNGGHGSTINAGLAVAKGKYIKIIDSDDWVNIDDFSLFVKKLDSETADIVVTNYMRDILPTNEEKLFIFTDTNNGQKQKISSSIKDLNKPDFFFQFSMPAIAIKTKKLKAVWGEGLLEKTFYVDQQFVAKCLLCSDTYIIYDLNIYRHFIGRPDQSIGNTGFFKHRDDHERVLRNLLDVYENIEDDDKKLILKKQIDLMLDTHYSIYSSQTKITKKALSEIIKFDSDLKTNYSLFYKSSRLKKNNTKNIFSYIKRKVLR